MRRTPDLHLPVPHTPDGHPMTARRLGPSAWRDDWMPLSEARAHASQVLHRAETERAELAAREDTMDDPTAREIIVTALEEDFGHLVDGIPEAVDTALEALDSKGYTITARASQAAGDANGAGDDAGDAHDPHGGAAGRTEPPMRPDDVPEEWHMLAVQANADRNHDNLCHCDAWPEQCVSGYTPDTWEHGDEADTIAAVIPTIREQAFATARAEIAKLRDDQTFDDELSATARVAYTVALNWIDRIARGDQ